jgi:hypothetical protein
MKKIKYLGYTLALLLAFQACEQETIDRTTPDPDTTNTGAEPNCTGASAGSANFSKFVAIGNSLTAGFQAGALFTEGQNNSLGKILATQFTCVGGGAFNQPDINSVNGFNSTYSNIGAGVIRGRLILFDSDGAGKKTATPVPAGTPGVPAPYNTADAPTPFAGDKSKLNNFGVPGIILGQVLTPLTGGPSNGNPAYNGLYARFASNPGTSTILGDAIAANGTFFLFWLGNNDVLGYAISGASGAIPMTSEENFSTQYNGAITTLLGSNPDLKGVVGNIPDVTTIPYFLTVLYNAIPLHDTTATQLNAGATLYNAVLDGLKDAPFNLPAAEMDARKISFTAGNNRILITDETLNDLGDEFDMIQAGGGMTAEQRSFLVSYEQVRQANATDLITLSAGGILGTTADDPVVVGELIVPQIYGVTVPLADQYVLIPTETAAIKQRTAAFNTIIAAAAAGSNNRIALADVNSTFTALVQARAQVVNGVTITPSFAPPTGAFSEDGVHPNSRGVGYMANIFIDAINAKFGASVPKVNLSKYKATGLPVNP